MQSIREVQRQNAAIVKRFFGPDSRMPGGAKFRASLCANGAQKQQCYPICENFPDEPPYEDLKQLLLSQPDVNVGLNLDAVIYITDDPTIVWAETIEYGEIALCGKKRPFKGHSNHIFHLMDGKITLWRYFPNTYPIRDSLEMPFKKLPRFEYNEDGMRDYLANRDPMRAVDSVSPDMTGGMITRIRVFDDYHGSLEDEIIRKKNIRTIFAYYGEDVVQPNGFDSVVPLYHEDGYTSVTYPHQDPTAELPNLFWEHHCEHGDLGPDIEFFIDCIYPTGDPNILWCENKSNGWHPLAPDGTPLNGYWNHYTNFFHFVDGKIYHMREIYDPTKERMVKSTGDEPLPQEAVDFYRYL